MVVGDGTQDHEIQLFKELFRPEGETQYSHFQAGLDRPLWRPSVPACQSSPQRTVCSWCNKLIQEGPEPLTHGICGPCDRVARAGAGLPPSACETCGVSLNDDLTCQKCGVAHSERCADCGRWGFHLDGCPEMWADGYRPAVVQEPRSEVLGLLAILPVILLCFECVLR